MWRPRRQGQSTRTLCAVAPRRAMTNWCAIRGSRRVRGRACSRPSSAMAAAVPRVRPEHTGVNNGEQAAHFVPHFDTEPFFAMKRTAPGRRVRARHQAGRGPGHTQ